MRKDLYTVPEGFYEQFGKKMDEKVRTHRRNRRTVEGLAACLCLGAALLLFVPDFSRTPDRSRTAVLESDCSSETLDLYESDIFLRNFEFE